MKKGNIEVKQIGRADEYKMFDIGRSIHSDGHYFRKQDLKDLHSLLSELLETPAVTIPKGKWMCSKGPGFCDDERCKQNDMTPTVKEDEDHDGCYHHHIAGGDCERCGITLEEALKRKPTRIKYFYEEKPVKKPVCGLCFGRCLREDCPPSNSETVKEPICEGIVHVGKDCEHCRITPPSNSEKEECCDCPAGKIGFDGKWCTCECHKEEVKEECCDCFGKEPAELGVILGDGLLVCQCPCHQSKEEKESLKEKVDRMGREAEKTRDKIAFDNVQEYTKKECTHEYATNTWGTYCVKCESGSIKTVEPPKEPGYNHVHTHKGCCSVWTETKL